MGKWGLQISREDADDYIEEMNEIFDEWNSNVEEPLKEVFSEINKNWPKLKFILELNKKLKNEGFKNVPELEGVKKQFSEAEKIYKRIVQAMERWPDFVDEFDAKIDEFTDEDGEPIKESVDYQRLTESKHDGRKDFSNLLLEKFGGL